MVGTKAGYFRSSRSEVGDVVQAAQVQRAGEPEHLVLGDAELRDQQLEHGRGDRLLDLEPDGRAEPAPQQLLLEGGQQVLGVVLLDLEVLVAGDPEGVDSSTSMPGNSRLRCSPITSSSGTKRGLPSGTNRGKLGGTFTRAKCSLPVFGLRTRTARLSESPEM